jgi:hypothetical protein
MFTPGEERTGIFYHPALHPQLASLSFTDLAIQLLKTMVNRIYRDQFGFTGMHYTTHAEKCAPVGWLQTAPLSVMSVSYIFPDEPQLLGQIVGRIQLRTQRHWRPNIRGY